MVKIYLDRRRHIVSMQATTSIAQWSIMEEKTDEACAGDKQVAEKERDAFCLYNQYDQLYYRFLVFFLHAASQHSVSI